MNSPRHAELQRFVAAQFPHTRFSLAPASADASFRSYWRVDADGKNSTNFDEFLAMMSLGAEGDGAHDDAAPSGPGPAPRGEPDGAGRASPAATPC